MNDFLQRYFSMPNVKTVHMQIKKVHKGIFVHAQIFLLLNIFNRKPKQSCSPCMLWHLYKSNVESPSAAFHILNPFEL